MTAALLSLDVASRRRPHLAARLWANPSPRAVLLIAHGHGEHGGCYEEFARAVGADVPVDILAFDFRGHGRSAGRRGVIRRYFDLVDDLDAWVDWASAHRPGLPVFGFGHSNGGLATIRLAETRPGRLAGLILTNPSLRLIADAPAWKLAAGRVLLAVAPWVTLDTGISHDQLTRGAAEAAQLEADPLRHQRISPPTYFGMLAEGPRAIADAGRIAAPTLLILGGADPVADPAGGRAFFDRLGAADRTLRLEPAMRHEPIHEVGRGEVFAAISAWLAGRIPPASAR